MTGFQLKLVALLTMFIDHAGAVFELDPMTRVIGRLAFPLFVFLIAIGFQHTKNMPQFLMRLGAFAIISEIPFDLALRGEINFLVNTNIFYTLFLGGIAVYAYQFVLDTYEEKLQNATKFAAIIPALFIAVLADILTTDYGSYGVVFIVAMYAIRHKYARLGVMAAMCIWQHYPIILLIRHGHMDIIPSQYILMIPATVAAVAFVALYNGKRGYGVKWLFYVAYPVHLMVFAVVRGVS